MTKTALYWLPVAQDWAGVLKDLSQEQDPAALWKKLVQAARLRLDFVQTRQLDRILAAHFGAAPPPALATKPVRLAVIASSTADYLLPSLRVAALRRGVWLQTYTNTYGLYLQELHDPESGLNRFAPSSVLVALDARHVLGHPASSLDRSPAAVLAEDALRRLEDLWGLIRQRFDVPITQQTVLPVFPTLLGGNEHRAGSAAAVLGLVNSGLRARADAAQVDLLAIDVKAAEHGLDAWCDPGLWHRAKQEIHPTAAPLYGELHGRLEAARQGLSSKALVLDLDNTLWGGVIGDDGLDGIVLGQGSAMGEAFLDVQHYALAQAKRGVILAVCSKNDESTARAPFSEHPEMVLKPSHIGAFVANWQDKASNLRDIAARLNIGVDALAFVDDNPFERNIVRRELPEVWVPELPEDPTLYARCLADAGLFEAVRLTDEDFERSRQYQSNQKREALRADTTDLAGYLKSLSMELRWKRFDPLGLARIVQLINKTNQFNLTTRRYTEAEVIQVMNDPRCLGLQFRLLDQFDDNGIIAIVIAVPGEDDAMRLDTWLMSCRVLGRQVEEATLNVVVQEAKRLGARGLIGAYRPSGRNQMVERHYPKLGFHPLAEHEAERTWRLDLDAYAPIETFILTTEADS